MAIKIPKESVKFLGETGDVLCRGAMAGRIPCPSLKLNARKRNRHRDSAPVSQSKAVSSINSARMWTYFHKQELAFP